MKRSAALAFEGGGLIVYGDGYPDPGGGHFAFSEDDLEPVTEFDDEDGKRWDGWLAKLPSSELAAIRDFLNERLPVQRDAIARSPSGEAGSAGTLPPDHPNPDLTTGPALGQSEGGEDA